jgi:predicted DNA-binding ribbon-helix-helix protein
MKSTIPKRVIPKRATVIHGRKTSVSIEAEFWTALKEIAAQRGMKLQDLVTEIDAAKECGNLSSAIRLFVLRVYRAQITQSARLQPDCLGGELAP